MMNLPNSGTPSRRSFLKGGVSGVAALAGLGMLERIVGPTAAWAQTPTTFATAKEIVQYALTLEKLEAKFYADVKVFLADTANLTALTGATRDVVRAAVDSYGADENDHVTALGGVFSSLGGDPATITIPANPNYNAVLGRSPFTDQTGGDLLLAAQIVEDLGVMAYKGQVQTLLGLGSGAAGVLRGALAIHSIEARHAAGIRYLRQSVGVDVRPWIRPSDTLAYPTGETDRGGIAFSSPAFDGYADEADVLGIVTPILTPAT